MPGMQSASDSVSFVYTLFIRCATGGLRLTCQSSGPVFPQENRFCDSYSATGYPALVLTHWGRMAHICFGKLTIIGSDNGLSPVRRQAIIWTNAGILLIGPSGTNFSEILIEIQTFWLKKIRLKTSSAKCCSFRLGLNWDLEVHICVSKCDHKWFR